jgi:hypothetical protein
MLRSHMADAVFALDGHQWDVELGSDSRETWNGKWAGRWRCEFYQCPFFAAQIDNARFSVIEEDVRGSSSRPCRWNVSVVVPLWLMRAIYVTGR